MKRHNRPAYWQLDLFVVAMIGLMVAIMVADLPAGWATASEIAWVALAVAGMSLWVYANWAALQREQREQRMVQPYQPGPERIHSLTPVQERFLAVMGSIDSGERVAERSK